MNIRRLRKISISKRRLYYKNKKYRYNKVTCVFITKLYREPSVKFTCIEKLTITKGTIGMGYFSNTDGSIDIRSYNVCAEL